MHRLLNCARLRLQQCIVIVLCLSTVGCATSSVFIPYPQRAETYKQSVAEGIPDKSLITQLEKQAQSNDRLLYLLELGRVTQVQGLTEQSKRAYAEAAAIFDRQDLQASLRARDFVSSGASLVTNDNAIPYSGAGYERIALHHFQAMNYWQEGDIEGAAVEFRKVALEQDFLAQKREQEIQSVSQEAREEGVNISRIPDELRGLDTLVGEVKASYLNPYTYYTSGAFREAQGDLNAALVDYKKALEMVPGNNLLREAVARVSAKQGDRTYKEALPVLKDNEVEVVVLFEEGFIPPRSELPINIPTFRGAFVSVAFPFYSEQTASSSRSLEVRSAGLTNASSFKTETLVDYGALAAKDLQEQIPGLLLRQTLRAIAKYNVQRQSGENFGVLGQFIANVYTLVSERADLRTWLTLPRTGQVQRTKIKAGTQTIQFDSGPAAQSKDIHFEPGRTHFLHVVSTRQNLQINHYQL